MTAKITTENSIVRIALSGAAGTGKTSLIEALEKKGMAVFHEYSRQLTQESVAQGSDVVPWDNLDAFTERVIEKRAEQHAQAASYSGPVVFDRTVMDSLAYYGRSPEHWKSEWTQLCQDLRYDLVFITPPWREIYTIDSERWESFEHTLGVHEQLMDTYRHFGYTVVLVPKGTVQERVDFVKQTIHSLIS